MPLDEETRARVEESYKKREPHLIAIGRFIVEFSHLEYTIKWALAQAVGVHDNDFAAVMSAFDFVKLCNVTKKLYNDRRGEENCAELNRLISKAIEVNSERVKVAHGLWLFTTDGGVAVNHVSRNGFIEDEFFSDPNTLVKLAREAQELNASLSIVLD